ncbi:predicted protein [Postia placenta Mad-698-R]|uniref:Uncharacterized protein n=1 Tax=Postia placenta MAD-698-R-SB12 TaxID=670580 RepID=A0A1X6N5L0_9APHY|nr:hypothetical protein POSPLADRAFT_1137967 [Postia placenta MAD-698-R-SB12]EED81216.1 predicted protein [Postia placenta Mad-698-R]OSX63895.1 hypothetical protein POSPLADRAFT_1137967 [Postia placenta MAD-698-R-SB12]
MPVRDNRVRSNAWFASDDETASEEQSKDTAGKCRRSGGRSIDKQHFHEGRDHSWRVDNLQIYQNGGKGLHIRKRWYTTGLGTHRKVHKVHKVQGTRYYKGLRAGDGCTSRGAEMGVSPHIQVLDSQTGTILHSTLNLNGAEKDALLKSGPIRCSAVDEASTHVITAGDDKKLKVWQLDGLKLLSERELPKKPTAVHLTRDGQAILVSDKFGDVFSYTLHPKSAPAPSEPSETSKRTALTSHENPSDGELILGHVSLLTCFLLSTDDKYILTADRDEHIRVSWFPQGYVIERYCLGHGKYVSALHVPPFAPDTLVSGGGDPMLKVWDWMTGRMLLDVPIMETVEPFIKVRVPKGKHGWDEGEGGEEEGIAEGSGNTTARRKKRGRRGRGKGKGVKETDSVEGTPDVEEGDGEGEPEGADEQSMQTQREPKATKQNDESHDERQRESRTSEEPDKLVLVIHKIASVDLSQYGHVLVFSAVGASALFYCAFPEPGTLTPPAVHALDLGQPVIDFVIGPENDTWVLLNPLHGKEDGYADKSQLAVFVSWSSGTVSNPNLSDTESSPPDIIQPTIVPTKDAPPLLSALQNTCAVSATAADLKTLDLYSVLSSMPKNVDPEHDPLRRDLLAEADGTPEPASDSAGKARQKKELTQRELARLKKKRAVAATVQKQSQAVGQEKEEGAGPIDEGGEREFKRAKSETQADLSDVTHDSNAMDES